MIFFEDDDTEARRLHGEHLLLIYGLYHRTPSIGLLTISLPRFVQLTVSVQQFRLRNEYDGGRPCRWNTITDPARTHLGSSGWECHQVLLLRPGFHSSRHVLLHNLSPRHHLSGVCEWATMAFCPTCGPCPNPHDGHIPSHDRAQL